MQSHFSELRAEDVAERLVSSANFAGVFVCHCSGRHEGSFSKLFSVEIIVLLSLAHGIIPIKLDNIVIERCYRGNLDNLPLNLRRIYCASSS